MLLFSGCICTVVLQVKSIPPWFISVPSWHLYENDNNIREWIKKVKNVESGKSQFYKFLKKLHVMKEEAVCVLLHEANWPIRSRKYVSVSFCLLFISIFFKEIFGMKSLLNPKFMITSIRIIVIYKKLTTKMQHPKRYYSDGLQQWNVHSWNNMLNCIIFIRILALNLM